MAVILAFGQTETKITIRDEESGNELHTGVHMPMKWWSPIFREKGQEITRMLLKESK